MTITFENEQELVEAIITEDVDLSVFMPLLLSKFEIPLRQKHLTQICATEKHTRESRGRIRQWKKDGTKLYCESDIPGWVMERVKDIKPDADIHKIIHHFVHDCRNYIVVLKQFADSISGYQFTQEGFDFIMFRLCREHYITNEDYQRWQFESGFFPHLFRPDGTKKDFGRKDW